ncbi:hypothetical protein PIROE2DRAFT_3416 [Piromyces sp. E2]|nr:hypothetical protein PIROE2DRAFT_3416 [Piromyces sp. E2]|eukprot:OUM68731.1 hypothetical protein PIROE2DRAFT_3416 [Piromyces sp. E2]
MELNKELGIKNNDICSNKMLVDSSLKESNNNKSEYSLANQNNNVNLSPININEYLLYVSNEKQKDNFNIYEIEINEKILKKIRRISSISIKILITD